MDKEARNVTIRIIKAHLEGVQSDLMTNMDRLEEIGCKREAKMLDGVCDRLEKTLWSLSGRVK